MRSKSLIVYYSRTEYTAQVAANLAQLTGSDLLRLTPITPYPKDYYACVEQGRIEVRSGFCPELKPYECHLEAYDRVMLASPIWCGTLSPPLRTFIMDHDLSGKTILPVCTHGGGGQKNFTDDLKHMLPNVTFTPTLILSDYEIHAKQKIQSWLKEAEDSDL